MGRYPSQRQALQESLPSRNDLDARVDTGCLLKDLCSRLGTGRRVGLRELLH